MEDRDMKTNNCIALWAAIVNSNLWAASANPYGIWMAVAWGALAVLVLFPLMVLDGKED